MDLVYVLFFALTYSTLQFKKHFNVQFHLVLTILGNRSYYSILQKKKIEALREVGWPDQEKLIRKLVLNSIFNKS